VFMLIICLSECDLVSDAQIGTFENCIKYRYIINRITSVIKLVNFMIIRPSVVVVVVSQVYFEKIHKKRTSYWRYCG